MEATWECCRLSYFAFVIVIDHDNDLGLPARCPLEHLLLRTRSIGLFHQHLHRVLPLAAPADAAPAPAPDSSARPDSSDSSAAAWNAHSD